MSKFEKRPPEKPQLVEEEQMASAQEALPLPYLAGTYKIALNWMTRTYNFTSKKIKDNDKKGGGQEIRDYWGTISGAICVGPLDEFHSLIVDSEELWPAAKKWAAGQSVTINELRAYNGRTWKALQTHTTTTPTAPPTATHWTPYFLPREANPTVINLTNWRSSFKAVIHWGQSSQTRHVSLTAAGNDFAEDHPDYKDVAYLVLEGWFFGRGRTTPPNVEVVGGRKPLQAVVTGTPATLVDGQCNIMAALAEMFTSQNFLGLPISRLNVSSFQAAADALQAKESLTGVSVFLSGQEEMRSILTKAREHCDVWIRDNPATGLIEAGVWTHGVAPSVYTDLTIDDLEGRPELSGDGWEGVKTHAVVNFTDRLRAYKSSSDRAPNLRAHKVIGRPRPVALQRPWITRRNQVVAHAVETLRVNGPQLSGTISVRREKGRNIQPGSWVRLPIEPEPGGTQVLQFFKVLDVTVPPTGFIDLNIDADETLGPLVFDTIVELAQETDTSVPAIANQRIIECPPGLSERSNVLALIERPSAKIDAVQVYFDSVTGGTFDLLGNQLGFAVRATLREDYSSAATGVLKVNVPAQVDTEILSDTVSSLLAEDNTLLAVVVKTDSGFVAETGDAAVLEFMSISNVSLVSGGDYDLTVLRERLGTNKQSFVTASTEIWLVRKSELKPFTHGLFDTIRTNRALAQEPDTGFFRLSGFIHTVNRPLADCTSIEFRWPLSDIHSNIPGERALVVAGKGKVFEAVDLGRLLWDNTNKRFIVKGGGTYQFRIMGEGGSASLELWPATGDKWSMNVTSSNILSIVDETLSLSRLTINGAGGVRIGTGSATARLHLTAGGTGANTAPVKIDAGTFNTSPENGAIERQGDQLTFVTSTGSRRTFAFSGASALAADRVVITSTGGVLSFDDDLTYDISTDTFGVKNVTVATLLTSPAITVTDLTATNQVKIQRSQTSSTISVSTSHLNLDNTSGSGQTQVSFSTSGTPNAGFMGDFQGNLKLHATGPQGFQFYTDLTGTAGQVGISSSGLIIGGGGGATASFKLHVVGTGRITSTTQIGDAPSGEPSTTLFVKDAAVAAQLTLRNTSGDSSARAALKLYPNTGDIWELQANGTPEFCINNTTDGVKRMVISGGGEPSFNTDGTVRYPLLAANATKTTAGAPYANDGYITVVINGTTVRLMTTA